MIKIPGNAVKTFKNEYFEIFNTGELAEGKWNDQVAKWARSYTLAPHAIPVNSNGAGLFTLLQILKTYRSKTRVFLQSNTMYGVRTLAISSGLELCGYVDCSIDNLMPTYEQVVKFVESLENPNECVFLITHIGGWVNPDIVRIAEFCKDSGIVLIEDCAHSLGSTLKGKHTGLFGDAGVYSLYATKAIPAGEGGIIVTNNKQLYEIASKFVIYDRFDQELDIGVNLRMSEINALLVYSVVQEVELIIMNKMQIADRYIEACIKYGWDYINPVNNGQRSNLYKFILLSKSDQPVKDFEQITKRTSPVYDYALGSDQSGIIKRHICLPIWYSLEHEVVSQVVGELKK